MICSSFTCFSAARLGCARVLLSNSSPSPLLTFLNLHLVRDGECSTVIFYHPDPEWRMTTAKDLQIRVRLIWESVYWQHIFRQSAQNAQKI